MKKPLRDFIPEKQVKLDELKQQYKNVLVEIGDISNYTVYLNLSVEEAVNRYLEDNPDIEEFMNVMIHLTGFDDEFWAYSVGSSDKFSDQYEDD